MTASKKEYHFNLEKMYFGEPFQVNEKITIYQPTLGDIIHYRDDDPDATDIEKGATGFFSMLNLFIQNTTSCRVPLWDVGVNWNDISDYQLFQMFITGVKPKRNQTEILFPDLDFSNLQLYDQIVPNPNYDPENEESDEPEMVQESLLYDPVQDLEINEEIYDLIATYLRTMFNMFPKDEFVNGKLAQKWVIQDEKERLQLEAKDTSPKSSYLLPLISACVNHPGFKYKTSELQEIHIVEFMDSVNRLKVYESSTALLKGLYSGFIDSSGIDPEELNFMRSIKQK